MLPARILRSFCFVYLVLIQCCVIHPVVAELDRPWQSHKTIDHVVILRICLPHRGKLFSASHCRISLAIFHETLLQSLAAQSAPFRMLAYVPKGLPLNFCKRIEDMLTIFNFTLAPVDEFFEPGYLDSPLRQAIEHYYRTAQQNPADIRISSRIDIDDMLHVDFFKHVQTLARNELTTRSLVVNQAQGYRMMFQSDGGSTATKCVMTPFHFPFIAIGQSLAAHSSANHSILQFEHTRERFIPTLLADMEISPGLQPSMANQIFKTVLLPRGYVHVRTAVSNSGNFMYSPKEPHLCSDLNRELRVNFGVDPLNIHKLSLLVRRLISNQTIEAPR